MKILSTTLENREMLASYLEAGVDEVILGLKEHTFSALQEFDGNEIEEIVDFCHQKKKCVSVLMNRLYSEADIVSAQLLLDQLMQTGVDGVMFADPGLLKHALEMKYESRMVYRPETLMTSTADAQFWKDEGIRSVVIPCLLTKGEIVSIAEGVKDTTVVIHGATLMSVSKRKLLSAYQHVTEKDIDVSSLYLRLQEKQRNGLMPVYENAYGTMIYTDYMQESFDEMQEFMDAGVTYFEIDTAFMKDNAILDAICAYRKILDGADASEIGKEYKEKYKDLNLSDGYYGQKTVK